MRLRRAARGISLGRQLNRDIDEVSKTCATHTLFEQLFSPPLRPTAAKAGALTAPFAFAVATVLLPHRESRWAQLRGPGAPQSARQGEVGEFTDEGAASK